MSGNSFGHIFSLTTFGESHGEAIGGIIDGCPSGLHINVDFLQSELDRRKPGKNDLTTQRKEGDKVEILSGVFEGKSTGTPIGFIIRNKDHKSTDYNHLKDLYRPSHADYTYAKKYGHRDHRGGGRSSARETASRVVAGAIAKLALAKYQIEIQAFVSQIGNVKINPTEVFNKEVSTISDSIVYCPDHEASNQMVEEIRKVQNQGDSLGGQISCCIKNCPIGLGEPVFDKLQADLAKAMLSINAAKGFEYGAGFKVVSQKGSDINDAFEAENNQIRTKTNHSGGIQGGISNGENIYFNIAFKATATISKKQNTVDESGRNVELKAEGRHDPCVVPRAVPIVESMAAMVILDHLLRFKSYQ